MSCDIRKYKSLQLGDNCSDEMILTAFVGGKHGRAIQFTIGGKYCALSESALIDLIGTISKRLNGETGYSATGQERKNILYKDKP